MRLHDRAEAAALLAPVVARRVAGAVTVLGIGAGGARVAGGVAEALGAPWSWMDLEPVEIGDALHPPAVLGAVAGDGRILMLMDGLDRLAADPRRIRAAVDRARAAIDLRRTGDEPPPTAPMAGAATVVVVDDGTSATDLIRAAVDLIRMAGAQRVTVAVACATAERLEQLSRWAGDVCVAVIPRWTDWHRWGGRIYDEDLTAPAAAPVGI